MITKVNESLEKSFWEYISHEESINLFIIGDVENYGLETEFQQIWFQTENEKIVAVMLKYYNSLVIYSYENDFDVDEMISFINTLELNQISGKKSVIDKLIKRYKEFKECKVTSFLTFKNLNQIDFTNMKNKSIEKASQEDLYELDEFLNKVDDMHNSDYIKSKTMQLRDKSSRIYFIKKNNKIISTISTGIESSFLAMICDIGTHAEYRNLGLATYITYELTKELVNEGKIPCLFYRNEIAGKIYKKIGYEECDKWSILLK